MVGREPGDARAEHAGLAEATYPLELSVQLPPTVVRPGSSGSVTETWTARRNSPRGAAPTRAPASAPPPSKPGRAGRSRGPCRGRRPPAPAAGWPTRPGSRGRARRAARQARRERHPLVVVGAASAPSAPTATYWCVAAVSRDERRRVEPVGRAEQVGVAERGAVGVRVRERELVARASSPRRPAAGGVPRAPPVQVVRAERRRRGSTATVSAVTTTRVVLRVHAARREPAGVADDDGAGAERLEARVRGRRARDARRSRSTTRVAHVARDVAVSPVSSAPDVSAGALEAGVARQRVQARQPVGLLQPAPPRRRAAARVGRRRRDDRRQARDDRRAVATKVYPPVATVAVTLTVPHVAPSAIRTTGSAPPATTDAHAAPASVA